MKTISDGSKLSPKQAKILTFIEKEIARTGRPPTYRDIAKYCGYEAIGTVQDHIKALMKKGFLRKEEGVARGLQLAHRTESIDIPILGTVPAGKPIEVVENALGSLSVPSRFRGELYALRVSGESMIGAGILDGDFVAVKKQEQAENGDIVVALINGEVTVKYLDKRDGRVRLLPANPKFSPIELDPESQNAIQGRVVAVHRYY